MHKIILILNKGASIPYLKLLYLNNYFMLRKRTIPQTQKKGLKQFTQAATKSRKVSYKYSATTVHTLQNPCSLCPHSQLNIL